MHQPERVPGVMHHETAKLSLPQKQHNYRCFCFLPSRCPAGELPVRLPLPGDFGDCAAPAPFLFFWLLRLGEVAAAAGVLTLSMPICCSCCICCCSCLACQQSPLAVPGHMLQQNCLLIVNLLNICCAADQVEGSSLNTTTKWFCARKRAWLPAKCLMHWTDLLSGG